MKIYRVIYLIFLCSLSACVPTNEQQLTSNNLAESDILMREEFNISEGIQDRDLDNQLLLYNASIVSEGKHGSALQLLDDAFAQIIPSSQISAKGGSISFWVKPMWDGGEKQSHTFVSMRWAHDKQSYMAISQGWWEPLGQNRLYFILSNQEFVHCSLPYTLEVNSWSMITVVWKSGNDGYCKIYIDGEKKAEHYMKYSGDYVSSNTIFLGSDKGATDQRGRDAQALIDEMLVVNRPFSDSEVLQYYNSQENDAAAAYEKKWKWLNEGLVLPWQEKRNEEGVLLESRVIFDEDIHWAYSKESADEILGRVKAAGFNVYVPCVWHGNGTYYPTHLTTIDSRLENVINDEYDPLAYLIEKAHSMDIEIHPWFTVMRRESSQYPEFYSEGVPEGAYDVHNKRFREFIINLMIDVVERYDVDGINLDYIRAMGICISSDCKVDYQNNTGYSLGKDYYLRYIDHDARSRIQNWQDNAVKEVVVNTAVKARALKQNLVISIDGHPKPPGMNRDLQGRDGLRWANEGYIDVVYNMDYNKMIDYKMADSVRDNLKRRKSMIMLLGNYDRIDGVAVPRDGDLIAKYVEYTRRKWPDSGVAFYIYNLLNDEQISYLKNGPFNELALPYWHVKK